MILRGALSAARHATGEGRAMRLEAVLVMVALAVALVLVRPSYGAGGAHVPVMQATSDLSADLDSSLD
jgi:hypothetical protein